MGTSFAEASESGYSLAYREARRGLEDQERSVVELRARAGALIAAAAITTSFFGGQTEFSLAPEEFIATYLEPVDGEPLALPLIERDLALHMGCSAELNRRQLRTVMKVFRLGAVLLVLEVLAWVMALAAQG